MSKPFSSENRYRALEEVETSHHPWEGFNTIFGDNTYTVDDIFNRGVRTDLETYVLNINDFETQFCKVQLNPCRRNISHRLHVLTGNVGRGKSTFIDYCRKIRLEELYGESLLQLFIDANTFENHQTLEHFDGEIIDEIENTLVPRFYQSTADYFKAFVSFMGYTSQSEESVTIIYKDSVNVPRLLKFIEHEVASQVIGIKGLLIIVDNIDENPKEVVKSCDIFVEGLIKHANKCIKSIPMTILVSVRKYNATAYFYTHKHINTDLRAVDEKLIVKAKIGHLAQKINENRDFPNIDDEVSYTIYVEDKNIPVFQSRKIFIKSKNVVDFLADFCDQILNPIDLKSISLLGRLSAGNLKILTANVFNLLHSNKLPLNTLFRKHFIPNDSPEHVDKSENLSFDTFIECLLSIHYPFYTQKESLICNLFNCSNSSAINDYRDLLVIPKVLCLLKNTGSMTLTRLLATFREFGYEEQLVNSALKKGFESGMFDTMYGVKLSQLDPLKSQVDLSSVGRSYLIDIIGSVTYFQYISEDCYVPKSLYISINKKYPDGSGKRGSKVARVLSAENVIKYIVSMEDMEFSTLNDELKTKYLNLFGIGKTGNKKRLSRHILVLTADFLRSFAVNSESGSITN